jgi:hypothetical protein
VLIERLSDADCNFVSRFAPSAYHQILRDGSDNYLIRVWRFVRAALMDAIIHI